jgi:SecD/SecF fusion protein
MASTVFTAVPIAVQLEDSHPAPPARPQRSEDSGARGPLERRGRARDSGAVV